MDPKSRRSPNTCFSPLQQSQRRVGADLPDLRCDLPYLAAQSDTAILRGEDPRGAPRSSWAGGGRRLGFCREYLNRGRERIRVARLEATPNVDVRSCAPGRRRPRPNPPGSPHARRRPDRPAWTGPGRRRLRNDRRCATDEMAPQPQTGRSWLHPDRSRRLSGVSWPLKRAPLPFETSLPGVLAVGAIRYGSVKRVAGAVGEGRPGQIPLQNLRGSAVGLSQG